MNSTKTIRSRLAERVCNKAAIRRVVNLSLVLENVQQRVEEKSDMNCFSKVQ